MDSSLVRYEVLMFWDDTSQAWCVQVPDLPGCNASGTTVIRAEEQARRAIARHLIILKEKGRQMPPSASHTLKCLEVDLDEVVTPVQVSAEPLLRPAPSLFARRTMTFKQAPLPGLTEESALDGSGMASESTVA